MLHHHLNLTLSVLADINISESDDVLLEFLKGFMVSEVHGRVIDAKYSSHSIVMIAPSCQCQLSAKSVASHGSHGDLMLIHVSDHIIGHIFDVKGIESVAISKITGTQNVNISII